MKIKVSIPYEEIKSKIETIYQASAFTVEKIDSIVSHVFYQVNQLSSEGIAAKNQKVHSIKCLDLWFYYIPSKTEKNMASIEFFESIQKNLGKPVLYEAGVEHAYGDQFDYVIKEASAGLYVYDKAQAAKYSVAIDLFEENHNLKRKIAWMEKKLLLGSDDV